MGIVLLSADSVDNILLVYGLKLYTVKSHNALPSTSDPLPQRLRFNFWHWCFINSFTYLLTTPICQVGSSTMATNFTAAVCAVIYFKKTHLTCLVWVWERVKYRHRQPCCRPSRPAHHSLPSRRSPSDCPALVPVLAQYSPSTRWSSRLQRNTIHSTQLLTYNTL